jgi:hypothetical protein
MTIKEAIIKSLHEIGNLSNYMDIYNHIHENGYYDFGSAKTPASTVSALLGDFIRNGDSRVKRIKQQGGAYAYYLSQNEMNINSDVLSGETMVSSDSKESTAKTYDERSLHKLLSSYLKSTGGYSKTIFHEQSNAKDGNQVWTHPDMVGVNFLKLRTKASQSLIKTINRLDTFKITSYEMKREISSDSELKKAYFQTVSNSSWANFGYLVAFEISDNLMDEMSRLNQSFGIGIIELDSNPYQSKVLFPSKYRELDFKTIDKLCRMNQDFERLIEMIEKYMTASDKYISGTEKELEEFCDDYFESDSEILEYLKEFFIPIQK